MEEHTQNHSSICLSWGYFQKHLCACILIPKTNQKSAVITINIHSTPSAFKRCLQKRLFEEHIWVTVSKQRLNISIFHYINIICDCFFTFQAYYNLFISLFWTPGTLHFSFLLTKQCKYIIIETTQLLPFL